MFPVLQLYSCSDLEESSKKYALVSWGLRFQQPLGGSGWWDHDFRCGFAGLWSLGQEESRDGSRTASPTLPLIAVLKEPSNKRVFTQEETTLLEKKQPKPLWAES